MRIRYCSAPCGSGKTRQLIHRACELVEKGSRVLVLQPTKELIDKTVQDEVLSRANPPPYCVFHQGAIRDGNVAKALADYVHGGSDVPRIVFATHQVLPHVKHFENKLEWHVAVDEELQVIRYQQHRIPKTHNLITDHLNVLPVNAIYGLVSARDFALEEIAKNQDQDEILETIAETSRIVASRKWETFVNLEQYERVRRGNGRCLDFILC